MYCKIFVSFVLFNFFSSVFSQINDSANLYKLKGIDVNIGGCGYHYGSRTTVNFAQAITPDELDSDFDYQNARTNNTIVSPVKIGLNFVFGNDRRNFKYFIHKHEALFRFNFETKQDKAEITGIEHRFNPSVRDISISYTYQTQSIGLGYQMASKPFLKNLALFMGVHLDFGMLALKQLDVPYYNYIYYNPNNIEFENYYSTFLRGSANLGLKYNFSCDINFFLQTEFAFLRYGKDIKTNASGLGACFGIRYKFLEDQDKLRYNRTGFW
jgi:hypothetical protein